MSEYIVTTEQLNWFLERMDETVAIPSTIAHLKPIVRCKDCVHVCNHEYADGTEWQTCSLIDSDYAEVEPDGFCAWGERKVVSE